MPDSNLLKLPLFPLDAVLFPHASVQLHIYDDRYRQLVHDARSNSGTFGTVLIRSQDSADALPEPYMVGTAVQISSLREYPDGQIEILLVGLYRFRIRKLDFSQPYIIGQVEQLNEDRSGSETELARLGKEAREEFRSLIEELLSRPNHELDVIFPPDPSELSYSISNMLQFDSRTKQLILETDNVLERLKLLLPLLREQKELLLADKDKFSLESTSVVYRVGSSDLAEWAGQN